MNTSLDRYAAREVEIARSIIGLDALHGIGYGEDYSLALRSVRATIKAERARALEVLA